MLQTHEKRESGRQILYAEFVSAELMGPYLRAPGIVPYQRRLELNGRQVPIARLEQMEPEPDSYIPEYWRVVLPEDIAAAFLELSQTEDGPSINQEANSWWLGYADGLGRPQSSWHKKKLGKFADSLSQTGRREEAAYYYGVLSSLARIPGEDGLAASGEILLSPTIARALDAAGRIISPEDLARFASI